MEKKLDNIEVCEEIIEVLRNEILNCSDVDIRADLISDLIKVSEHMSKLETAEREFMAKSENDANEEREFQLKLNKSNADVAIAGAGLLLTGIGLVAKLCVGRQMFYDGLKFEQEGTIRSHFVKGAANLNNLFK